jgi:hypothetical protein
MPLIDSGISKPIAGATTFVASGLLHEYILLLFSMKFINGLGSQRYSIKFGNQFLFFVWNGLLLVLEQLTRRTAIVAWISKNLPKPIITGLVLLTVLPVAHWFTDECRDTGFFTDYARGFPRIVMLS